MASFVRNLFSSSPVIPVVRLEGVIQPSARSGSGISFKNSKRVLDKAFSSSRAPGVAIVINSPGGAPAQSHLIAEHIVRLSKDKKKPALAFVEDSAASGGYLIAVGADEIYANPFSIIGSVGVIMGSFGFTGLIQKIGVERRLMTAGKNKAVADPFSEISPESNRILKATLETTHEEFKAFVKQRRGSKLQKDDEFLFEGEFWLAKQAHELGLIDGVGNMEHILKTKFGADVKLKPLSNFPGFLSSLPFASTRAHDTVDALDQWMEGKSYWARVGL